MNAETIPARLNDAGVFLDTDAAVAIQVQAVEKAFGVGQGKEVRALGPLDLEVRDGDFVSVVGPSGCGKSTLLRIMAGLVRPSVGRVTVNCSAGKRIPIAMVFQNYGIYPWKTVASNIRFGLEVSGLAKREADDRVRYWMDRMGLQGFGNHFPDSLSGGMQQRVAIARALAVEPEILLMDEPFAALDAQLRELLQDELLGIVQAERRTVVFVTHSLEEALVLGDRVVVMTNRPGQIVRTVDVPFGRPRSGAVRNAPEFGELRSELWELLRVEVLDTSGLESERPRKQGPPAAIRRQDTGSATRLSGGGVRVLERTPGLAERQPARFMRRRRAVDLGLGVGFPLLLIGLWQLASMMSWINPFLWPAPASTIGEAVTLVQRGLLLHHLWDTTYRLLVGFALGAGAGVVVGVAMGMSRIIRATLDSTLGTLYTVPKLALLPILLTTFGFGDRPIIVLVAITVFFFAWISTLAAVMSVSAGHREAAAVFGVSQSQMFRHVIMPAALPQVLVGLRVAMGVSVLAMIGAELLIGQSGIGFLIQQGQSLLLLSQTFVAIILAGVLGYFMTQLVRIVGRRIVPWSHEDNSPDRY